MTEADAQAAWTTTLFELPAADGEYTYRVSAEPGSARSTVALTVDRTRPEERASLLTTRSTAGQRVRRQLAFTYSSSEPGSTFACRFFGPGHPEHHVRPVSDDRISLTTLRTASTRSAWPRSTARYNADATPREYTFTVNTATGLRPHAGHLHPAATTLHTKAPRHRTRASPSCSSPATVGTGIADGQGAWTANVPLESADGEYTYRVDFGGHGRDRASVRGPHPACSGRRGACGNEP